VKRTVPVDLMSQALTDREVREYSARRHLPARQKQHHAWRIQGPFPWAQWCIVARLPGKALAVWQLIHHRSRISRQSSITLPHELLVEVGISRWTKNRALELLERHGLIRVDCRSGRSVRIALVAVESDGEDETGATDGGSA
jgi:hypothetical protein